MALRRGRGIICSPTGKKSAGSCGLGKGTAEFFLSGEMKGSGEAEALQRRAADTLQGKRGLRDLYSSEGGVPKKREG